MSVSITERMCRKKISVGERKGDYKEIKEMGNKTELKRLGKTE